MPTYTFRCRNCGKVEDVERSIAARNLTWYCDCGGGEVERVYHFPHIVYRTAGFNAVDKRLEPTEDDFDD